MDFTEFYAELAEDFTEARLEHAGGTIVVPRAPVDLEYLSADMFPDDCDSDTAYAVIGPAAGLQRLITFEWREDSRQPWSLSLEYLTSGDRLYLTMPPDPVVDQPWEAFAAIDNPGSGEILDALVFDLLWDNGESYDIEILSSLPTSITSELIGKETVRAAIHLYLDWDEMRTVGAWRDAASLLPEGLKAQEALASAAHALAVADSEPNRDSFMAAYVEAAYRAA